MSSTGPSKRRTRAMGASPGGLRTLEDIPVPPRKRASNKKTETASDATSSTRASKRKIEESSADDDDDVVNNPRPVKNTRGAKRQKKETTATATATHVNTTTTHTDSNATTGVEPQLTTNVEAQPDEAEVQTRVRPEEDYMMSGALTGLEDPADLPLPYTGPDHVYDIGDFPPAEASPEQHPTPIDDDNVSAVDEALVEPQTDTTPEPPAGNTSAASGTVQQSSRTRNSTTTTSLETGLFSSRTPGGALCRNLLRTVKKEMGKQTGPYKSLSDCDEDEINEFYAQVESDSGTIPPFVPERRRVPRAELAYLGIKKRVGEARIYSDDPRVVAAQVAVAAKYAQAYIERPSKYHQLAQSAHFAMLKGNPSGGPIYTLSGRSRPPTSYLVVENGRKEVSLSELTDDRLIGALATTVEFFEKNPNAPVPTPAEMTTFFNQFKRSKESPAAANKAATANTATDNITRNNVANQSSAEGDEIEENRSPNPHARHMDEERNADQHTNNMQAGEDQPTPNPATPQRNEHVEVGWGAALSASFVGRIIKTPASWFTRRSAARPAMSATEPRPMQQNRSAVAGRKEHRSNQSRSTTIKIIRPEGQQTATTTSRSQTSETRFEGTPDKTPTRARPLLIGGRKDSHLPFYMRGTQYKDLPVEWQRVSQHMKPQELKETAEEKAAREHEEHCKRLVELAEMNRRANAEKDAAIVAAGGVLCPADRNPDTWDSFNPPVQAQPGQKRKRMVKVRRPKEFVSNVEPGTFIVPVNIDDSTSEEEIEMEIEVDVMERPPKKQHPGKGILKRAAGSEPPRNSLKNDAPNNVKFDEPVESDSDGDRPSKKPRSSFFHPTERALRLEEKRAEAEQIFKDQLAKWKMEAALNLNIPFNADPNDPEGTAERYRARKAKKATEKERATRELVETILREKSPEGAVLQESDGNRGDKVDKVLGKVKEYAKYTPSKLRNTAAMSPPPNGVPFELPKYAGATNKEVRAYVDSIPEDDIIEYDFSHIVCPVVHAPWQMYIDALDRGIGPSDALDLTVFNYQPTQKVLEWDQKCTNTWNEKTKCNDGES